jgi:hypothetical protein|tara:strand:+ start:589 stop:975 length:387 start_codon:yes stop_codon:yes gene_type:complete
MEINHVNAILLLVLIPSAILVLLWWGLARAYKKRANGVKTWRWPYILGFLVFVPYGGLTITTYYGMITAKPRCKKFHPQSTAPNIVESYGFWTYLLYHYVPYQERPFCPEDQKAYERHIEKQEKQNGN